jgi:CheY-like chemotaxis protein
VIGDSQSGGGTRMRVLFPMQHAHGGVASAAPAQTSLRPAPPRALKGRVVVCDDNSEVADFLHDLLVTWQLDVQVFQDPVAALKYCEMQPGLDLVIVDQTMPVITGLELAQLLRRRRPHLPIVLYTGYSESVTEDSVRRAGIDALVRKPLDIDKFHCLVESLLKAPYSAQA